MSQDLTLAYAAGLLDGEGHYGIGRTEFPRGVVFGARVVVNMTHRPTIEWLQLQFGGNVTKAKPQSDRNEYQFSWRMGGQQAILAFLPGIIPFSRTKKVHATLLLDFLQAFPYITSTVANKNRQQEMEKYFQVMKALNSKGPNSTQMKEELTKVIKIV